jgi:hypothetical protein
MEAMKTIHIENQLEATLRTLARQVFTQVLNDDLNAHFLFEDGPILILRMSDKSVPAVKQILGDIPFEIYSYPKDDSGSNNSNWFFETDFVAEHLDLFLPIFHANCVAALTLDPDKLHQIAPQVQLNEFHFFIERTVHTFCNAAGIVPHQNEGKLLAELATLKLGSPLYMVQRVS